MVPKLRDSLKEMGLVTLQDRRKRDLITLHKIVNGIEKLEKQDLVIMEEGTRQMRGHSKKIKKEPMFKGH